VTHSGFQITLTSYPIPIMSDMKIDAYPSRLGKHWHDQERPDESETDQDPRPPKRQRVLEKETALIKSAKPKPKGHDLRPLGRAFAIVLSYHPKLWHSGLYEHVAKFLNYADDFEMQSLSCTTWSVGGVWHLYDLPTKKLAGTLDDWALASGLRQYLEHIFHERREQNDFGCWYCGALTPLSPSDRPLPANVVDLVDYHPPHAGRGSEREAMYAHLYIHLLGLKDERLQQYFCRQCNPKAERQLSAPVSKWRVIAETAHRVFRPQREANRAFLDRMIKEYGSEQKALLSLRDRL
jgi:hypothetical protein